jgi:RimJ/RimL family protein N-acetyltransferase
MDIINCLISFGIFDRETGELFGTAGAGRHDDLNEPEIFYQLLPQFRGNGYATEAVKSNNKVGFG